MPCGRAAGLLREIARFVTRGPEHHAGEARDLTFLRADRHGRPVEPGASATDPRFCNAKGGRREKQRSRYASSARVRVLGVGIKAVPNNELGGYESSLGREVGPIGINQLTGASVAHG